jgi:hypothetical protein
MRSGNMWKVSDVLSVELERYGPAGYGFNVTTDWGKPLVTFGYETQEEAQDAAQKVKAAIERVVLVRPHAV